MPTTTIISDPKELDILVGKETRCRTHKGSLYFRAFVESYRQRYQDAPTKQLRTCISKEMYDIITQASCRFLKYNESLRGWEEINETASLDKITHALRYAQQRRRRQHTQKQKQQHYRQGVARTNSDTSRRSEASSTTTCSGASFSSQSQATSYTANSLDLDALMAQEQKLLSSINISSMNASLRAYRQSCRTGNSASANASTSTSNSTLHNSHNSSSSSSSSKKVSFAAAAAAAVNDSNGNSFTSSTTAATTASGFSNSNSSSCSSSLLESIPLPVDLSTTQHTDINQRLSRINKEEKIDQPPRMPARPRETSSAVVADYHQESNSNSFNNNDNSNIFCHSIVEETSSSESTNGENIHPQQQQDMACNSMEEDNDNNKDTEADGVRLLMDSLYLQDNENDNVIFQNLEDDYEHNNILQDDDFMLPGITDCQTPTESLQTTTLPQQQQQQQQATNENDMLGPSDIERLIQEPIIEWESSPSPPLSPSASPTSMEMEMATENSNRE